MNPRSFRAGDLETYKALPFEGRPGQLAPTIVCGSMAEMREERDDLGNLVLVPRGKLLPNKREALHWFEGVVCDEEEILTGVNIVYDLACLAAEDKELLPFIFQAIRQGRVYDAPIAQSLDAIFGGHLGLDPRTGQKLRDPLTNKEKKRYSLEILTVLVLGRDDAKDNDAWRTSYALLEGIPAERWPWEAVQYPIDDAENTLGITIAQAVTGWKRGIIDPETGPARNLGNMAFQVRAAFALHLGACRGLRTDRARVEALDAKVEAQHAEAVKRYQGKGWIRPEGTEDQASVKRSVALAYGAVGKCATCGGTGKKPVPCRGEKIRGRFAGCVGKLCPVCGGTEKLPGSSNCRIQIDEEGKYLDGCDGTGLDLQSAPMLPRTDKQGVSTDRDTLMESGDDDLSDYGENEFEKTRSTYLPWLKRGIDAAVTLRPNVLVATGRCSYEDPLHQMPRGGGVRECIVARPGWVFSSTDYEAGELCTLAQYCYWVLGHSAMRDIINETGKPGILHSALAAEVLGLKLEEFLPRLKAKDKQAVDFRQASKCFHPDTEILTRQRGWVKMIDLTMEDEVASVEPDKHITKNGKVERRCLMCRNTYYVKRSELQRGTGRFCSKSCANSGRTLESRPIETKRFDREPANLKIVWTKPERLTKRHASQLVHLKNESIDLRVTPDHRMLAFGTTDQLLSVDAKDFGDQRGWFNAGMADGSLEVNERLLRLAVATQADGNYIINGEEQRHIRFGFSKQRKIDRMASLLSPGEYTRGLSKNGQYQLTTRFSLSEELSTKVKTLLDSNKTLPWWWLNLTPALREVVLDEARHWDSHDPDVLQGYLYTSYIEKNLDVLQAISCITGRKARKTQTMLSVKAKNDSRGENVSKEIIDYDGEVYCLTVPSGCVLVRDGGVPVITQQCVNFGVPGGMGVPKQIAANRKKNAGSTTYPDGRTVAGIRFCVLVGGASECGLEKITEWKKRPTTPVCKACCDIVESVLRPAYFARFPEIKEYFNWVSNVLDDNEGRVPCLVWNADKGEPDIVRWRGGVDFSAACNNGFQAMLGDVGKLAFADMIEEAYTGCKPDGSPSPLAGDRPIVFMHDEPLCELKEATAHLAGPRIAEIMMAAGKHFAPDVTWVAETAIARYLSKGMEPVYRDGKLVLWEPKQKEAA